MSLSRRAKRKNEKRKELKHALAPAQERLRIMLAEQQDRRDRLQQGKATPEDVESLRRLGREWRNAQGSIQEVLHLTREIVAVSEEVGKLARRLDGKS